MPEGHTVTLPRERRAATTFAGAHVVTPLRTAFTVTVHGAVPMHAPGHTLTGWRREPSRAYETRTD
jgi:hypothetical protein